MTIRLLFVCSGNICRSPTAEAVMRALVRARGLESEVEVDSAGTGNWHAGESADRRAAAAALRRGVHLDGVARQVTPEDFEHFDLLLAMDSGHLAELRRMAPPGTSGNVRLFTDTDVPDPYYGGEQGFETVLDMVEAGCADLLDSLGFGADRDGVRQG
jgi:protein-tyrosine phosphatase